MATPEVQVYLDSIGKHLKRLEKAKAVLRLSGENAQSNKRLARKVSIILGALIAVVGIVLARVSASDISLFSTGIPLREVLSYISAIAGAAVSFVNERFDPARLREREVALGDLVYKLEILEEDAKLNLSSLETQSVQAVKVYFEELRKGEDALLEEAEEWKAGIRRFVTSDGGPNNSFNRTRN